MYKWAYKELRKKHTTIIGTKEKEYNNTWQKHGNTNWIIEIWRKTPTIFFFYLHYLNKNLIVLRGLSYLWLLMLYICIWSRTVIIGKGQTNKKWYSFSIIFMVQYLHNLSSRAILWCRPSSINYLCDEHLNRERQVRRL